MQLTTENFQALADLACHAATEAGALIASYRDREHRLAPSAAALA